MFSSTPGQTLFYSTSMLGLLCALGSGLFLTVDALNRERREGTLGLLFLTELRGYDIVLGKLASASAAALSGFLAVFPIMALSLALGGVTGEQFWRMIAALLTAVFFSLSFGLLISALVTKETYATLAFLIGMVLPTLWGFAGYARTGVVPEGALVLNPLYPAFVALALDLGPAPPNWMVPFLSLDSTQFLRSVTRVCLLGMAALAAASIIVPWSVRPVWERWLPGLPERKRQRQGQSRRISKLERHPVLWLAVRDKTPAIVMWALMAGGLFLGRHDPLPGALNGLLCPLFLHYVIKWHLAYEAGRLMAQQRSSGLLETLITTPIPAAAILRSNRLALRRHFLAPVILAIVAHAAYIFSTATPSGALIAAASMVVLFADFFSLSWLGIWAGLRSRSSNRAFLQTLVLGLALPWVPFFMVMALLLFVAGGTVPADPALLFGAGVLSAAGFAGMAGIYAMGQAHYQLRKRIAAG